MQIIERKKFVVAVLALNKIAFMVYVAYLGARMQIHLAQQAQMSLLLAKKVSFFEEYTYFLDVLTKKSAIVLPNCSNINKNAIDLNPGKQLSYRPIHSSGLIELEIFKTYIKVNLANRFIQPFKSLA